MVSARFNNVINSQKPVLVDFYTDWCAPCKSLAPILKDLKAELNDSVRIIKVNLDKNPLIATKYNIRSVPTMMLFKNGAEVWTGLGLKSKNEIKDILLKYI